MTKWIALTIFLVLLRIATILVLGRATFAGRFGFLFLLCPEGFQLTRCVHSCVKWMRRQKSLTTLELGLPYFLDTLGSCLRAGLPLPESFHFISSQNGFHDLLNHFVREVSISIQKNFSFEYAVHNACVKFPDLRSNRNFEFFLNALVIGYKSGGDTVQICEKMKGTIVRNTKIRRKLRSLTSQMRAQALFVTLAPSLVAAVLFIFDRSRISFFYESRTGVWLLAFMILLNLLGALQVNALAKIKLS